MALKTLKASMLVFASLACVPANAAETALQQLRIGTIAGGTVSWELETILKNDLDRKHGFDLEVTEYAGNSATQIALQGGAADVIVTDWIWAARAFDGGLDISLLPFSTAVGAVMVPADSDIHDLEGLEGKKLAIAGGPLDKSWLILKALAASNNFDLEEKTTQVFGAPPLVMQALESGEVDGAINYWHFNAKADAAGMRELVSVADGLSALGLDASAPLLVYAVRRDAVENGMADALRAASSEAKALLQDSDDAWEAIRPIMNAANDEEFAAMRSGWLQGVPQADTVDVDEASRFFEVLAKSGGPDLTGGLTAVPAGLFHNAQ